MHDWLLVVLIPIAVLVALKAVGVALIAAALLRARFQAAPRTPIVRTELSEAERAGLDLARAELEPLGFILYESHRAPPLLDLMPDGVRFIDWYVHPATHALAEVGTQLNMHARCPFTLNFQSHFQDGTCIATFNRELDDSPVMPAYTQAEDPRADSVSAVWEHHVRRLQAFKASQAITEPAALVERGLRTDADMLAAWEQAGRLQREPGDNARWRIRTLAAFGFAWRSGRSASIAARPFHLSASGSQTEHAQSDFTAFEHAFAAGDVRRQSSWSKLVLFLITGAVAGVSFGWAFTWEAVPALLAVLVLHEGGHYVAMRLTGHRNVNVFFVPFLGAATTGKKDDASPMQLLLVYLAGPVPGLILGLLCLLFGGALPRDPAWIGALVSQFGWMAVIVNLINLLPIFPLDGGRVIEVLLLGRLPRARLVFAILGVLAFVAAAFQFGDGGRPDYVMLAFAVLVALALPHQWRTAGTLSRIRRAGLQLPATDRATALRAIFDALPKEPRTAASRLAIARAALPAMLRLQPGLAQAAAGIAIYLAAAFGPLMGAGYLVHANIAVPEMSLSRGRADYAAQVRAERDARMQKLSAQLAATTDAAQRWKLLFDAAEELIDDDQVAAGALYHQAWDVAQTFDAADVRVAKTRLALANHDDNSKGQRAAFESIVRDYEHGSRPGRVVAAEALDRLAWRERQGEARVALLSRALALREDAEPDESIAWDRVMLAQELDQLGRTTQAEALLQRNVGNASAGAYPLREHTWFLIAHDRPGEALQSLDRIDAFRGLRAESRWEAGRASTAKGWALIGLKRYAQAQETFELALAAYGNVEEDRSVWARLISTKADAPPRDPGLMLDAIHAAMLAGDAKTQARWTADFREYIDRRSQRMRNSMLADLIRDNTSEPWMARRRQAHAELIKALGYTLPPEEPSHNNCRNPDADDTRAN